MNSQFIPAPRTFSAYAADPRAASNDQPLQPHTPNRQWAEEDAWQEGFDAGAMGSWHNGLLWGLGLGGMVGGLLALLIVQAGALMG